MYCEKFIYNMAANYSTRLELDFFSSWNLFWNGSIVQLVALYANITKADTWADGKAVTYFFPVMLIKI